MSETITGVTDTGLYVFNAIRESTVWYYSHKNISGHLGQIHGNVEMVVRTILQSFPDVYYIEYRGEGKIRTSYPAHAESNKLATLVAEELTR